MATTTPEFTDATLLSILADAAEYSYLEYERISGEVDDATDDDIDAAKAIWDERVELLRRVRANEVSLKQQEIKTYKVVYVDGKN